MATANGRFRLSGIKPIVFGGFPEADYMIRIEEVKDAGLSQSDNPKVQIKARLTSGQRYANRLLWDTLVISPVVVEGTDDEIKATQFLVSKLVALGLDVSELELDVAKAQRQIRDFVLDSLEIGHVVKARLYEEADDENHAWIKVRYYHTPIQEG